jgi:hypothetical protein
LVSLIRAFLIASTGSQEGAIAEADLATNVLNPWLEGFPGYDEINED